MLITRIDLSNVKSYRDQSVTFAEGTNAICGANGAGKSTLLEAIGFALFDFMPYKQENFVREGARSATVTVHLVSGHDERTYQVVRRCGQVSDYYVFDPELGIKIVSGKADVVDWLREHMGVEPGADLSTLFKDAVGVPQGLLTAVFLETDKPRKAKFDRLLQVDEYEVVYERLRDTLRYVENTISDTRQVMAGLEAQTARLPVLRDQEAELQNELAELAKQHQQVNEQLAEASARCQALEATRQKRDEHKQRVDQLGTRLEGLARELNAAQEALAQAQTAKAEVEASRPGYEAYEAKKADLDRLEQERTERDKWSSQRSSQERQQALTRQRIEDLERELREIQRAEQRLDELRPRVERQQHLQAALEEARDRVRDLQAIENHLGSLQANQEEVQKRLAKVEEGLLRANRLGTELQQVQAQLEEAQRAHLAQSEQQAACKAESERLKKQLDALQEAVAARCPVCEQPLTSEHRADLLARIGRELEEQQARLRALTQQLNSTMQTEKELGRRRQQVEAELRTCARPSDRDDLQAQLAALQEKLSEVQQQRDALADSPSQVQALQEQLSQLDDPQREYGTLESKVARRAALEADLQTERERADELDRALLDIERALAPFNDLEERLQAVRDALQRYEDDHKRYLAYARIASDLAVRQKKVQGLQQEQVKLQEELGQARADYERVAASFDEGELAAARQEEQRLRAEQGQLQGKQQALQRQAEEVGREVEALQAAERQLAEHQRRLERHQQLLETIKFLRDTIRQAGPHVIRRLVQRVSLRATRLYADVMLEHSARLSWQENYAIVLEKDGRQRGFEQLSGGEQMAGALAVRLALLRELSGIDVAFFDEPTSNLDATRRDNLAEQILAVRETGFSQLFVISHDDTFERAIHHIVRVSKEQDESRVEIG